MSLFSPGRNLRNSTLIYLSNSPNGVTVILTILPQVPQSILFQSSIVEPDIIVPTVLRELILVLNSSFTKYGVLEGGARSMLLLKLGVRSIECG